VVDIITALATAGHVSKLLKELLGIDKAVNAAEFKFKIAELTEAVSALKLSLVEAKDDLATKDAEIERLKKQLQRTANLIEFRGYKYDANENGLPKGQAYCPVCEQKEGMLFHLSYFMGKRAGFCPACNSKFDAEQLPE
jgi:hypothetical protein